MGQIIGRTAKPKRCNLNKLSQLGTPAAGEYILVSSDNSMDAAGQGDFDAYVKGDGATPATELELKSLVDDGAFDISAYRAAGNVLAKYVDLSAALDGGNNIPEAMRKGGISVKFVQSSDNKYVQYFLTKDEWSASEADWEKMNLEEEVSQLQTDIEVLSSDISGMEEENTETIPAGYNYTQILQNLLLVDGETYTINAKVTTNPGNVYVKAEDEDGTELFRISMNGTTILTGQYIYTSSKTQRITILAAAPAGSTTVTVQIKGNKVPIEERIENLQTDTENLQTDTENLQTDTENLQTDIEVLRSDIFKVEDENSETIPAGYDYTPILQNIMMVADVTYTINAKVTTNPKNVYVKAVNEDGTELFRISMNGISVLTGQYIYTPSKTQYVDILAAAPAGSTTVTVQVEDNKATIEERIEDIEGWIAEKNGGKKVELENIEFGGLTRNGVPRTVSVDFGSFFSHFRTGKLLKTGYLKIELPGIVGCAYSFDGNFVKQNEIPFVDELETHASENDKYFALSFSKYNDLNSRKTKGYLDATGAETTDAGCLLSSYFSRDELRHIIMTCNFTPMRVYIHCYDEDYNWIKRFQYEVSASYVDLSNTSSTDFPDNGVYYRVVLIRSFNFLTDDQYNSVKVCFATDERNTPKVSATVSSGFFYSYLPRLGNTTLNFIYKTVPHNCVRYSESFINENYIDEGNFMNACLLMLPKTYAIDGKPTRLIIWCGGTGSYSGWQKNDFYPAHTKSEMEYLAAEGFAVACFLGATSKYIPGYWNSLSDFGLPTSIDAHVQGYNYLCNKYNIAKDGCFVAGKSLGGLTATQLLTTRRIPVLACCPLAPKLNSFPTSLTMDNYFPGVEMYAEEFQFDDGWERFFDGSTYTEEEKNTYMKSQLRKVMGYIPMINGIVGKTFDELWNLARYGVDDSSIGESSRFIETPIRIYISIGDEAVSYNLAKNYIKSLQNGGSPAELRTWPAPQQGESGHAMVDTAPSCPKVASVTTKDGTLFTDVPLTFVEMVQFFRENDMDS